MKMWFVVCFGWLLSACSSPNIEDYRDTSPSLVLNQFFSGNLIAHGVVLDINGKLTRRFTATIKGTWNGEQGVLDEQFLYDDGEQDVRVWELTHLGEGEYKGTANDVIGVATGQTSGAAFYWKYQLEIEVDGKPLVVTLDDWMYLIDDKNLINRSKIIKYGLEVGEVILNIRKLD
jgi:hypothetical protein